MPALLASGAAKRSCGFRARLPGTWRAVERAQPLLEGPGVALGRWGAELWAQDTEAT